MYRLSYQMLIFIVFIFINTIAFAQFQKYKFQHYSIADGLSQGRINCITQDSEGFMWFGSDNGLNKFDGYSFTVYKHNAKDTTSLSGRKIINLFTDSKNRMWVGCGDKGGLNLYSKDKDNFTRYLHHSCVLNTSQSFVITGIAEDDEGYLFVGTNNGLYRFNPDKKDTGIWLIAYDDAPKLNEDTYVKSILIDSNNNLWIGKLSGLYLYNKETTQFINIANNKRNQNSIGDVSVNALAEFSENIILAGTWGQGLYVLKYTNEIFRNHQPAQLIQYRHDIDNTNSISYDNIFNIYKDRNNILWLSTENGLNQINNTKQELLNHNSLSINIYKNDPQDIETIDSDFTKCSFFDNSNVLWIGTTSGLNKSKNYKFSTYKQQIIGKGLRSNKIQVLFEDKHKNIWIGTSKGINLFNISTGSITYDMPNFGAVITINTDPEGLLWIGTWDKGLHRYNPKTNKVNRNKNSTYDSLYNLNGQPSVIFTDSNKKMWFEFWSNGLFLLDFENNEIIPVKKTQFSRYITTIFEDSKHNIWFGSIYGLGKLRNNSANSHSPEIEEFSLLNTSVSCIIEDNLSVLWIGTSEGLIRLNPIDNSYRYFTQEHGLPSNEIMSIVPDNNRNLWISTINGISKFSIKELDKNGLRPTITNYSKDDGLQGREFLPGSSLKCSSGEIIFGGKNGFNIFDPKQIIDNNSLPNVVFTDFQLFNEKVSIDDEINGKVILSKSISQTKKIALSYNENFFTVWFSAMHYNAPEYNKYKYKLQGYDINWNDIGEERKVTFIGLKPGYYTLHVKAANSDNVWNNIPASLHIQILPPWWQTIWFRVVITLVLLFTILMTIRMRTINLKRQKLKLEQTVEMRTQELKNANIQLKDRQEILEKQTLQIINMNNDLKARNTEIENMAKQLHEADQKQLRFFTNISHEFRTPLTLIIGPLSKFVNLPKSVDWNKTNIPVYISLMHRNSMRLLRLVNQILDFRKLKQQAPKISPVNNNIVEFISGIVDAFMPMAEAKNILIGVKSEELRVKSEKISDVKQHITQFWFDADVMEKILYNLISNAIKNTPEGGQISITIGIVGVETRCIASLQNDQLAIKISDTGVGIKQENLHNIFDRFYSVKTRLIASQPEGTGIGLAYTKEMVNLHQGQIFVDSEFGKGSTFTLTFPLNLNKSDLGDNAMKLGKNTAETRNLGTSKQQNLSLEYTKSKIAEEQFISNSSVKEANEFIATNNIDEINGEQKKDTLLIVEDNQDMQIYVANELNTRYNILLANDGSEGYEIAMQEIPDLIVSDVMMPVMDGIELSKKLKSHENTCHIPIILLTAKAGEDNILKGLETGADDYLNKPFSTPILKAKIENLLKTREILREKFSKSIHTDTNELNVNAIDKQFLDKAIEIIEKNMADYHFSNDKFVSLLGLGRTVVYKKIKALTNKTLSEFIHSIRLKKAAQLLLEGKYNIGEVSDIVGYKHRENFYQYFTAMFGKSPSQFINENK